MASGGKSSGKGGGSSKGQLYKQFGPEFTAAIRKAWEAESGDKPKKWFTQYMGVDKYDDLYEKATPGPHQDEWDKLDWHTDYYFKKASNERAIAFMDSIRRDFVNLYGETEINSLSYQKNSDGKWISLSEDIRIFLDN